MVDMSGEQRVQFVLGGNASQRNEADHIAAATIVFPVLIPDESDNNMHPETGRLSLEAKSNSSSTEQTVVKRKRGRPRKIKPSEEEQSQSGKIDANQQQPGAAVKSGRPKRSEQSTTKRDLGGPPGNGGGGGEASAPVKRNRGRPPKKVATSTETSQSQVQPSISTSSHQAITSSEGITTGTHASTDIFNAVQQLAQDAVIVSAIHGTPVQVLPTTAVASMNTIDAESPLRASAPISVTISPTRDDTGTMKWTAGAVTSTPPSRTTDEREKRGGYGVPLNVYQLGASTPPLLHAEQPEILNSLPQCSLSSGEVSVKIVDRLAAGPKEGASRGTLEEVHHDTRYLKQPEEGDMSVIERKGTRMDAITGSSAVVIDSGNQSTKLQKQPAEVKPQLEPPPVKRKRGRPPKSKNTSQQPTSAQEQPAEKDTVSSVQPPRGEITVEKPEPTIEAAVTATDPPVVKRKTGRPPKVKIPKTPSESPVVPPTPPPPPEATNTSTTVSMNAVSMNGEENKKPRKRGRPPKSTKTQVQTSEASGEVIVKRGRGRPRKYPIPAVAASGPFLPSVSGITLPAAGQNEGQIPTQGNAPPPQIKNKQQQQEHLEQPEGSQDLPATAEEAPVNRKRGRPPKNPDGPPPAKRKPGRPRILPSPDLTPQKRGRPRKNPEPEPVDPTPRKRGRPRTNPSPDPSPRKRGRPKRNPTPDLSPQKRGRPRKRSLPGEESAPPKKPGRPKKNPVPDNEKVAKLSENQPEQQNEQQETEKLERQISPKIAQKKETSPIIDVMETTEPLPKRKRGRPKKVPPAVAPPPLQEPTSFSSLVREPSASLLPGVPEKPEEGEGEDDRSPGDMVNLSLQISFSDSDSEHSDEKMESNAIMALADRVVAPSPSPPRERDSPLLNPSFEESYDEDSDPDSK